MAASAVGYGQMAIRYAIKAGEILNKAKEIVPHGEFIAWLHAQLELVGVAERTAHKWMKLAKSHLNANLLTNPNIKGLQDAYIATGILPEPDPKQGGDGNEPRERPPFTLSFKTQWRSVSDWSEDAAKDFLYDFERLAQLARALKTQFGL